MSVFKSNDKSTEWTHEWNKKLIIIKKFKHIKCLAYVFSSRGKGVSSMLEKFRKQRHYCRWWKFKSTFPVKVWFSLTCVSSNFWSSNIHSLVENAVSVPWHVLVYIHANLICTHFPCELMHAQIKEALS